MNSENLGTLGPVNGALLIHGGGDLDCDRNFKNLFIQLAGGVSSRIIYIPTAFSDEQLAGVSKHHLVPGYVAARFGFRNVTVLHTRDSNEANSEDFIKPIIDANAVFFTGGRQWRLADAYLNTRTHEELRNLLERGGVIAGSSAGATIQGSFLVRGHSEPDDNKIMIGDHQQGFGFISNIAIDQHLLESNRQFDMFEVLEKHKKLLGVGIDSNTFIYLKGNEFTVIGKSYVAIYNKQLSTQKNGANFVDLNKNRFILLGQGRRYNLKTRNVIS